MFSSKIARATIAIAAASFAAACADPVSPGKTADVAGPSLLVGTSNSGAPLQVTVASGTATTAYCYFAGQNTFSTTPGSCASPLLANAPTITTKNDYWTTNIPGSSWIGPVANADQYVVAPGAYTYQTSFTVPANVTGAALDLQLAVDNNVTVYLNYGTANQETLGASAGENTLDAFQSANGLQLYTTTNLIIGGTNTLTFVVNNTRTNYPKTDNTPCALPPGATATGRNYNVIPNYDVVACNNPSGLRYLATVRGTVQPPRVVARFVIGDKEAHAIGDNANFWGAQWWKNNFMTGTTDNGVASFKGYADFSDNVCGGTWTTRPGNSSNPPATIPTDIAVIVTSNVFKNGPNISGNIKQIVMVHQDGNYKDNPGHAGNGPITSIVCGQ